MEHGRPHSFIFSGGGGGGRKRRIGCHVSLPCAAALESCWKNLSGPRDSKPGHCCLGQIDVFVRKHKLTSQTNILFVVVLRADACLLLTRSSSSWSKLTTYG
ncbi:unnamed protein product [Ectocarpus fasciculatus]